MTTARTALRAPAPTRQPPRRRPPLRVVAPGELAPAARRRRARLVVGLATSLVVAGLFGLAVFNVMLAQGQVRLNEIEQKASAQQDRYERLRLEVARLESPERVVASAQERLGMVPPETVHYLAPAGSTAPAAGAHHETAGPSTPVTADWSQVKPHLAAQR